MEEASSQHLQEHPQGSNRFVFISASREEVMPVSEALEQRKKTHIIFPKNLTAAYLKQLVTVKEVDKCVM